MSEDQHESSLTTLTGVGPALADKLGRLGVFRVDDLLFLLPLRYEDRTRLVKIGALEAGERCLVQGEVLLAERTTSAFESSTHERSGFRQPTHLKKHQSNGAVRQQGLWMGVPQRAHQAVLGLAQ